MFWGIAIAPALAGGEEPAPRAMTPLCLCTPALQPLQSHCCKQDLGGGRATGGQVCQPEVVHGEGTLTCLSRAGKFQRMKTCI